MTEQFGRVSVVTWAREPAGGERTLKMALSGMLVAASAVLMVLAVASTASADAMLAPMVAPLNGVELSRGYQPQEYYSITPPNLPYPATQPGGSNRFYDGVYPNAHIEWCVKHYRTYNPVTNIYYRAPGVPAFCHSPFG